MRKSRLQRRQFRRSRRQARLDRSPPATILPPNHFEVLCRIDAYADYVSVIGAESAEEAAELAHEDHGAFRWEHRGVVEFDDRLYVALNKDGWEIEGTEVGDR